VLREFNIIGKLTNCYTGGKSLQGRGISSGVCVHDSYETSPYVLGVLSRNVKV
jgi:hypothetical protein